MNRFDALKIFDFDHLEFAVADVDRAAAVWLRAGFEKVASREIFERKLKSQLLAQNQIYILLSSSTLRADPVSKFVQLHGDGVCNVAFRCEDAVASLDIAANRGAEVVESPKFYRKEFGSVHSAAIRAIGDVRHTFISRHGNLFAEGFEVPVKAPKRPAGPRRIDHVCFNVETDRLNYWTEFYERVLGIKPVESYPIETTRGKLTSRLFRSEQGLVPLRLNEPAPGTNPVREYLDINHGPGLQSAAFTSENILATLRHFRRETIPFRRLRPGKNESWEGLEYPANELRDADVWVERRGSGSLLHAYTQNLVGPFFLEILQRNDYPDLGQDALQRLLESLP